LILLNSDLGRLRHYRRMQSDHGHSPDEIAARLASGRQSAYLKDMIYGAIDGAVTTFAIVAGVEGAGLSSGVIVALGVASILADGFSMAASNYSGTKAELDDRKRIVRVEERHLDEFKDGEMEELRQILAQRGLSGDVLEQAAMMISQDRSKWINIMLTDEYGLSGAQSDPARASIATFLAFLAAGSVPLTPYVLGLGNAFQLSVIATLLTFFLIGAGKSRWSLAQWWWSGLETFAIGATAALIAYGVGSFVYPAGG